MPVPPKLSPKSLNEWTLEQNLVREISDLFDSPFGVFYPVRLRNIFDISAFDISRFARRRTRSYKLTPGEEGRDNAGWDAKFVIPPAFGRGSRVLYMQIKSGKHSDGNTIPGSIFNTSVSNPNPHAGFTFNDNGNPSTGKKANQHQALKNLNDYLVASGFSEKSVLYAFPRVTELAKFDAMTQPLIYYTTFISHQQMDREAKTAGADLYDGEEHYFRTCYLDDRKREISSEPFELNGEVESGAVLQEVLMVKLTRLWNDYYGLINNSRLRDYLIFALADELAINPFEFIGETSRNLFHRKVQKELALYFQNVEQNRIRNEGEVFGSISQSRFTSIRNDIFKNVFPFVQQLSRYVDVDERVPSVYTNSLNRQNRNVNADNFQLQDADIQALVI